jgi:cysteine dioxygenase
MATLYAVEDLVDALRELGGNLQPVRVASTLRDLRLDERSLAPYLSWAPARYTRNLIVRDPAFELIGLCWDAGVFSPIHDHADSDCAFVLAQGAVRCDNYRVAWSGEPSAGRCVIEPTGSRILRQGQLDMTSGHLSVHRVGACEGRAVTLHVYAKPIDACLNFDEDGSSRLTPSRYDTVPPRADLAL